MEFYLCERMKISRKKKKITPLPMRKGNEKSLEEATLPIETHTCGNSLGNIEKSRFLDLDGS